MKPESKTFRWGFILSLLVHGTLIALLLFSIQTGVEAPKSSSNAASAASKPEIVQAAVVDASQVEAEVKRLEQAEVAKQENTLKREQLMTKRLEEMKQNREKEQLKLAQLKKDILKAQKEEESRLSEMRVQKEKERKELEALKQKKETEKKQLDALDERRQEEQERAVAMRSVREKEEKKRLEQAKMKNPQTGDPTAPATVASQTPGVASAAAAASSNNQFLASELARYQSMIKDKVRQSWIRAPGLKEGLSCKLEIELLPDGSVINAHVIASSGNLAFDQSAAAAVMKASPLPIPGASELMEKFRHFTFEFDSAEQGKRSFFN